MWACDLREDLPTLLGQPSVKNYWRALILFGRNVASYKFAQPGRLIAILRFSLCQVLPLLEARDGENAKDATAATRPVSVAGAILGFSC